MRDEVLMELVDKAVDDEEFRTKARQDPEGTLRDYGFDLTDEELQAVKDFQRETEGLSDADLTEAIAGGSGRRAGG